LILCRDFYNSIYPLGPTKKDTTSQGGSLPSEQELTAHHKKVRQWFLNPSKYCTEIEGEQRKHPGNCTFHLSKSHPTHDCNVKKDCEKLVKQKKFPNSSSSSIPSDQLQNLKEEIFEDAVADVSHDVVPDSGSNDTNEDKLNMFNHLKNHYFHLVKTKSSTTMDTRHNMPYPVIPDSGAKIHMFKELEFSESIPAGASAILGDGKSKLPTQGIGTKTLLIKNA